jgi:putative membrane protein
MKHNRSLFLAMAAGLSFSIAMAQIHGSSGTSPQGSTPMGTQPNYPGQPGINNPNVPGDNTQIPQKVDDRKFVKDAALGGMTEVELGKLATEKASSDAVKQFGQKMIDDHSKANDELKQAAAQAGINVPDSLDSKHQSRVDKLAKLSGPDFDKAYLKDELKDHQQDVREFESEAQNGSDPNVKSFASRTLPVLQGHLSMVKDLTSGKSSQAESDSRANNPH